MQTEDGIGLLAAVKSGSIRGVRKQPEFAICRLLPLCPCAENSLAGFAEIEIVIAQAEELPNAEQRVCQLAKLIGLEQMQPRSYLSLLLEKLSS